MRGRGRRAFLGLGLGLGAGLGAWGVGPREAIAAPPIDLRAELSSDEVEVGKAVRLTVKLTTNGGLSADLEVGLPKNTRMELVGSQRSGGAGSSFSISFGTGQTTRVTQSNSSRSETRIYNVVPLAPGEIEFEIHALSGGTRYPIAKPPILRATGMAIPEPKLAPTDPAVTKDKEPDPKLAKEAAFLHAYATPSEVYVGQALDYRLELWNRTRGLRPTLNSRPIFKDLWSEEVAVGGNRRARAGRSVFLVQPLIARTLFPQRAGEISIRGGDMTMERGGFFISQAEIEASRKELKGPVVTLKVRPLPAQGQPANFRAHNVGAYKIATKVDRRLLSQGDALKLTVEISGEGNVRLAEADAWPKLKGLSSYAPEASDPIVTTRGGRVQGRRQWTALLIAERAGTLEIPAHSISYFDPVAERYVTAKSEPIEIEVTPTPGYKAQDASTPNEELARAKQDEDPLAPVSGAAKLNRDAPRTNWLPAGRFDALALGMIGLSTSAALGRWAWQRWGPDDVARARAEAEAWRLQELTAARASVQSGEGFWSHAAALMQARALARLGPQAQGRTREELAAALSESELDAERVSQWRALLDRADAARFGAGAGAQGEREDALKLLEKAMDDSAWGSWDGD